MTATLLRTLSAPVLLASLATAGCSTKTPSAPGGAPAEVTPNAIPELRSTVPHDASPAIDDAQKKSFIADADAFAFALYHRLAADPAQAGRSVFLSPLSVSFALGMTSAGAKGQTLEEMRQALHFSAAAATTHAGFDWLKIELAKRAAQGLATVDPSLAPATTMDFNLVNALFAQDDFTAVPAFLDTLSQNYDAGVGLLPFISDPDGSRQRINGWVVDQTSNRIKDLLPQGSITPDVRLVVINAVSMGAPWQTPFLESATADATFTKLDGSTTSAPLMHMAHSLRAPYLANDDLEAAALPLLGGQLEVVLIAPKPGKLAAVEASIDGTSFAALRASFAETNLEVAIPRFSFTSDSVSLEQPLKDLGMKLAFSESADFSGISATTKVHVFDVLHKAMVSFDESGIQAAAATAVVIGTLAAEQNPTPFVVDRAFLLGIRDQTTGALLFWGRIASPL